MPPRAWTAIALVVWTAAALALRVAAGSDTLAGDRARPFSDDPPYHALRIEEWRRGEARPGAADPRVAHPYGAVACWPWGFDALMSGWASLSGADDLESTTRAASRAMPLLGALLVPIAWALARRPLGRRRALAAAAVVALLPAHVGASLTGRVDHHVLEPLLLALALIGPLRVLGAAPRNGTPHRRGALAAALSGLAAGAAFAVVPAALPLTGLAAAVAGPFLAVRAPGAALAFAAALVASAVASLALSPHPGAWVYYSPSLLHAVLIGATGLALATAAAVRSRGARPAASLAAGAAAGLASLGVASVAAPPFLDALAGGLAYVGSTAYAALSLEAQPLLADLPRAARLLSPLALLAPVGGLRLLVRGRPAGSADDTPPSDATRALGLLILASLALAAAQRRFLVASTPFLAVGLVEGVLATLAVLAPVAARLKLRPVVARVAAAGLVLAAALPALAHLAAIEPLSPRDRAMYRAAEKAGPRLAPGEGALVPWEYGHVFQYAGAPTVCDNFFGVPESDDALRRCLSLLYEEDEAAARATLDALRVGLVVLSPPHPEEIRVEARLLGRDPDRYVTRDDRLTPAFARTLWGRLGLWASGASPGDTGPYGLRHADRVTVRSEGGEVAAEVLVFDRPGGR